MLSSELNLRHLRAFSAVVQLRSLSAAATQVYLSQPAISHAIAKLELLLETQLFERYNNGMHASEPGKLFANRVDRAMVHIQTGVRRAIRIGCRGKREKKSRAKFDQLLTSAQLRALIAVSEAGNFSLAARNSNISQPTLHRAARDLERLSGLVLFVKTSLGIELSSAAQVLAQHTRLMFYELDQGIDEVKSWRGQNSGRIAIGTMPMARTYILPKAIREFATVHPEIDISVIDAPYGDLLHGLRHGEIDCLVGALRDPLPIDDVEQQILFHDTLAVVAGPNHPLVGKTEITVQDLANFPWVVPRTRTPTRDFYESLFREHGLPSPQHAIESSSLLLIRGLLVDSNRLTIISRHQIIYEERQGHLVRLNFDTSNTSRPIGLTTRRDWQPTASQSLLIDLIKQACSDIDAA